MCCGISPCGVPRPSLAAYVVGTGPRARRMPPESASVGDPPAKDDKHHLFLEAYGYRWYRVGGLDYLLKRSDIETSPRG